MNLFPEFPGFATSASFRSTLVFHERWCSPIRQREIDAVLAHSTGDDMVRHSVAMFVDRAECLVQQGGPMVLVCVPPHDLLAAVDERRISTDMDDQEIDESGEAAELHHAPTIAFHDLLKAEGMRLSVPIQMVRPKTYAGNRPSHKRGKKPLSTPLQDEATRAWNIHTALYYKAGGIPWRLLRDTTELATCFVGISFYRSLDQHRLLTSVAQVFNERGEGVIVKGAQAQLDKNDKTPHLSEADAHTLLKSAINVYRQEHRTSPARIVVHKTSRVLDEEARGFDAAAQEQSIDSIDLLLHIEAFPDRLYIAGTECRRPGDVWALLRTSHHEPDAGWVLKDKRFISFHDLSDAPWSTVCDAGTVEGFSTADWSESSDVEQQRLFVQLLNQTLRAQLHDGVRYWPYEDCFAFTGRARKLQYKSLKRESKLSVISQFSSTSRDGRTFEWRRHLAFRGRFHRLDADWYLEITPTYRFTHDGFELDRFHEDRLKGIKQIEGNRAVLSCVLCRDTLRDAHHHWYWDRHSCRDSGHGARVRRRGFGADAGDFVTGTPVIGWPYAKLFGSPTYYGTDTALAFKAAAHAAVLETVHRQPRRRASAYRSNLGRNR